IDIMRWFLVPICGEIKNKKSIVKNHPIKKIFDEAIMALFEFESGVTAEIFCSITFDSPFQLELYTDNGAIIGNDLCGDKRKIYINLKEMLFENNNPYIPQMDDFLGAICFNRKPEVDLVEGIKNVDLMVSIKAQ